MAFELAGRGFYRVTPAVSRASGFTVPPDLGAGTTSQESKRPIFPTLYPTFSMKTGNSPSPIGVGILDSFFTACNLNSKLKSQESLKRSLFHLVIFCLKQNTILSYDKEKHTP